MSDSYDTDSARPPLFPWPPIGLPSTLVDWPTFLHLAATACEHTYTGAPGRFLSAYIHALGDQADRMRADSPESHEALAEEERLREAAWVAAIEAEAAQAGHWSTTDQEDDPCDPGATGSLLGHDDGAQRAWLACDPDDETYMN
jgi:hypothetical protein